MNAKDELIQDLLKFKIKANMVKAVICFYSKGKVFSNLNELLHYLDFEYDEGLGGQELYGLILFDDGTWMERGEYDGSEWWEYKKCPTVEEIEGWVSDNW